MLVLALGLAIDWPWPWDCGLGLGLGGLALAKNSRPISWQNTKFTINFHQLEHGDCSELYFKIHVPYLLTVCNHDLVRVLEKQDFVTFYRNPLHYVMALALALSVLALLTLLPLLEGMEMCSSLQAMG